MRLSWQPQLETEPVGNDVIYFSFWGFFCLVFCSLLSFYFFFFCCCCFQVSLSNIGEKYLAANIGDRDRSLLSLDCRAWLLWRPGLRLPWKPWMKLALLASHSLAVETESYLTLNQHRTDIIILFSNKRNCSDDGNKSKRATNKRSRDVSRQSAETLAFH